MADFTVVGDTKLNTTGVTKGLNTIKNVAGKSLAVVGKTAAATTAGLGAIGTYAVKAGSSFEEGMSQVQAISGATSEEMQKLTNIAQEMGAKTKFSATESAEALKYMAMAGWKTDQMISGLPGIMDLAAASGEDLATVSDIVTDSMTAFGMEADQAAEFADILSAASSNSNTNVAMMGETFKYVAPVAGSLGYNARDCSVAIGLMANSGIKASQAGTSLRSMLTRMAKPTKQSQAAMDKLNLSLTDSAGNIKPLNELMTEMREKFANLTDAEKAKTAAQLAGTEAMSGMLAIVNASDEDYEKLTKAIENSSGAAEKMADTMQNNLKGQFTLLKSACEGLGIAIYDTFDKNATKAVKKAQKYVNQITKAVKKNGIDGMAKAGGQIMGTLASKAISYIPNIVKISISAMQSFANGLIKGIRSEFPRAYKVLSDYVSNAFSELFNKKVGGAISEFLSQIQKAAGQLVESAKQVYAYVNPIINNAVLIITQLATTLTNTLGNAISFICRNLDIFGPAVAAITAILVAHKTVVLATTTAHTALAAVMALTNPWTLATVAIGGVATAVALLRDDSRKLEEAYNKAKTEALEYTDAEKKHKEAIDKSAKSISELNDKIKQNNESVVTQYNNESALWEELQSIVDANGKVKKGYTDRAKVITTELSQALGTEIKLTGTQIENYKTLKKSINDLIEKKTAEALLDANKEEYTEALKQQNSLYKARNKAESDYKKTSQDLKYAKLLETEAQKKYNAALIGQQAAMDSAPGEYSAVSLKVDEYRKKLEEAKGKVDGLTEKQNEQKKTLDKASESYANNANVISNYKNLQEATISGSSRKIKKAVTMQVSQMKTSTTATLEELTKQRDDFRQQWEQIKIDLDNNVPGVTQSAVNMAKQAYKQSEKEVQKAENLGKDFALGFANGIANNKGKVVKEAVDQVNLGLNYMQLAQDSHSPSKKTKKLGKDFSEGYSKGISENKKNVNKSTKEVVAEALTGVKNGSRESTRLGSEFMDNFEKAISGKKKKVKSAAKSVGSEIKTEVKNTFMDLNDSIKEANSDYEKLISDRKKKHKSNLEDIKKTHKNTLKELKNTHKEALSDLKDEYAKTCESIRDDMTQLSDSISDSFGLFEEVNAEKVISNDEIIANSQKQTKQVQKFYDTMNTLKNRNIPGELLEQLEDMGVNGADQLEEFSKMSDAQLNEFVSQWKTRQNLGNQYAENKYSSALQQAKTEYIAKVDAENTAYKKKIEEENKAYKKKLEAENEAYSAYLDKTTKTFNAKMKKLQDSVDKKFNDIGQKMKDGLKSGAKMSEVEASSIAKGLTDKVIENVKKNFGIHSPSRVFENIGNLCLAGYEKPFKKYDATGVLEIQNSSLSSGKIMSMQSGSANRSVTNNNNQTINFNQPVQTPAEAADAYRRMQIMGLAGAR